MDSLNVDNFLRKPACMTKAHFIFHYQRYYNFDINLNVKSYSLVENTKLMLISI